jgi:hypothetical protein
MDLINILCFALNARRHLPALADFGQVGSLKFIHPGLR